MADDRYRIPALRVRQWLRTWDGVEFDEKAHRRKPEPHFYLTAMDAGLLKRLTGVRRREVTNDARIDELGIQRRHDAVRSSQIADYVRYGYPWSDLAARQRKSDEFHDLRKPGWLPTALVVNILTPNDSRGGDRVAPADLVRIGSQSSGVETLELPPGTANPAWRPTDLAPLEIIDGQHRLWAFDEAGMPEGYQLPVVAFHGLDRSWQAYLFYVINIKPKKINRSLAFDLYPLLRTEDWLNRFEGAAIYRETRAQELTEIMWSHPASPWKGRINMVGDPGKGGVTQAAWIRSLLTSFIKGWEGRGRRLGGLYGAPVGSDQLALPWTRAQQAAFLILLWERMSQAVQVSDADWVEALGGSRSAMLSPTSLLNTDQGLRVFLQVANDFAYLRARELKLFAWRHETTTSEVVDLDQVTDALRTAASQPFAHFLDAICGALATFDWRTSAAQGLTDDQRTFRMAFRGSGGYGELRRQVLGTLRGNDVEEIAELAHLVSSSISSK